MFNLADFSRQIEAGGETYTLNSLASAAWTYRADMELGYAAYWMHCKFRYAEQMGAQRLDPIRLDALQATGLTRLPVLSATTCARLRQWIDVSGGRVPMDSYDLGMLREVLTETFSPAVEAVLRNHFSSHYFVPFINFFRTDPGMESPSYNWHCDWGPTGHLKLFCYLAEADSHDGSTIFLDRDATSLLLRAGYAFGQDYDSRNRDLAPLCAELGIPYAPQDLRPGLGEAAVFEPGGVIHRGNVPRRGSRYVMQIGLIPSVIPWSDMHDQAGIMLRNNMGVFPDGNELIKGRLKF